MQDNLTHYCQKIYESICFCPATTNLDWWMFVEEAKVTLLCPVTFIGAVCINGFLYKNRHGKFFFVVNCFINSTSLVVNLFLPIFTQKLYYNHNMIIWSYFNNS